MINSSASTGFDVLSLPAGIQRAINDLGFDEPTTIQKKAIPAIRNGSDIIGRSQTGTGKTVAFAVPAVEMISNEIDKSHVLAIIMLPTRELAIQCCEEFKKLTKYCEGIRPVEVYGGAPMDRQITRLKRANIVIGTPGRIMDHMRRRTLKLDHVKLAVLDEADEMLSMGFKEDMETILRETPSSRQTVLFSATMPDSILSITEEFQKSPIMIEAGDKKIALDNITQSYINVPMGRKTDALCLLLHYYSPTLSIVFCNTKKMAEELALALTKNGFNAEALHGDLKQSQRTTIMDRFRSGSLPILVATDVAARGIDVSDVEYVFNYDIPQNNEYYVHRIGRTGRIGKKGDSITICSGNRQVIALTEIARMTGSSLSEINVPTTDEINYRIAEENISSVEQALSEPIPERYRNMVNMLLANGHSLFDIACAALSMNFSDKEIKINDIVSEKKQRYNNNGEFIRIILDIGRSSRVAPNHLVASITERSLLHGGDIGKIEIFDNHSLVSIPKASAEDVLDSMYGAKVCGKPVRTAIYEKQETKRFDSYNKGSYRKNDRIKSDKKKKDARKAYKKSSGRHRK